MKADDRLFTQIINGTTQFVIPVFQRDYSWAEEQCEQLWADIDSSASGKSERGHFLGSVVYVPTGASSAGFTQYLLIDGQQRVTTLSLLLAALRDHINEHEWSGDSDDPTTNRINAYFLKNLQEDGDRQHKLVLRRHDQETFQSIIEHSERPDHQAVRIVENYEWFKDKLSTADPAHVYRGIGRLIIVDVILDPSTDDPQLIFESLNSTGVDLSESDLIRNFLLMRLPEARQTELYYKYWSKIEELFRGAESTFDAFARDYLALKTRARKQEKASQIYQAFRRNFESLVDQLGGLDELLEEMLRYAKYYAAFSLGVGAPQGLEQSLARLRKLVDVPAMLIMRLFDCYDRLQTLSRSEMNSAIHLLESYVFRRAICGEQTRGYWQVFASLAYKLDEQSPLQSLEIQIARLRENYRFPSSAEFHRALIERDLYGLRVCMHLLEQLENHGSKEPTDVSGYSIEHVMPQNENLSRKWREMLGEDWEGTRRIWLHRLGNLTLTGYNSTYSDRPFEDKKTMPGGFAESSVRLNKFIREQQIWSSEQMEIRGKALAERAITIWPELTVDPAKVTEAELKEMRELAARRNVNDVEMSEVARDLLEQLRARVLNMGDDILEMPESKTVSYHGPDYFLEVLPRKHRLTLLVPLDFNEIDDPHNIASDATEMKFFIHAKYEGGVSIGIESPEAIEHALPIIKQSHNFACP